MARSVSHIPVQLLRAGATLPRLAHPDDAGADLYAAEEIVIPPGKRREVATGIALAIPEGYAGFVQARSGLAFKHGIMVVNAPGLIDAGYRGEIKVCLFNSGGEDFPVQVGDRIAQMVVQAVSLIHISEPTRLRRISYAVFCLKKKKNK